MTTEKLLISQILNWLNSQIQAHELEFPCYITLGSPMYTTGEGIWVQLSGKAQPTQKYLRGKITSTLSFSLYYRLTDAHINGIEAVMLIPSETLENFLLTHKPQTDNFLIKRFIQTNGGVPFSRGDDGTLVYQSLWQIDFEVI